MLYISLEELSTGGYCFGDRVYIRDNLHGLVNADIVVTYAKKIGLDVASSALVILFNGRNITSSLIEELIRQEEIIKSDTGEIIFRRKVRGEDWHLCDLKTEDRVSLELRQDIYELETILKTCLKNCESFNGDPNSIKVVDKAYGIYWDWETDDYFCIFDGSPGYNNNITYSLIEKLQDLNLLYNDCGKYVLVTDRNANIAFNYRADIVIQNILFFFVPLILICGLLLLFFGKILAILTLIAGTIYFILRERKADFTKTRRDKVEFIEGTIVYILKWGLLITVSLPIGVLILGPWGLVASIGLLVFAVIRYKKLFRRP